MLYTDVILEDVPNDVSMTKTKQNDHNPLFYNLYILIVSKNLPACDK